MSNVKKPNQHLENLIKADGFEALPYWYRFFIHELMLVGQSIHAYQIYSKCNFLRGYIRALFCADVITYSYNLYDLIEEAEKFAIDNNVKKAA